MSLKIKLIIDDEDIFEGYVFNDEGYEARNKFINALLMYSQKTKSKPNLPKWVNEKNGWKLK